MWDLIIISVVFIIIFQWLLSNPFIWKGKGIPWSIPLPIIGNTCKLLNGRPMIEFWDEFYNRMKNNKIHGFHYFFCPALNIKDPSYISKILVKDADHFTGRDVSAGKHDPLRDSIIMTEGSKWKTLRAKMTPFFTPARIKASIPYIEPIVDRFVQHINQESKKGPVDVQSASLKLSTDVTVSTVFGLQPECFDNPQSFFYCLHEEFFSFLCTLRTILYLFAPNVYDFFHLTMYKSGTIKVLSNLINDVINQRNQGIGVKPDFMQGMVDLLNEDEKKTDNNNDLKFNKNLVQAQCMIMYEAGSETTGNTIGFILYELALHQEIQEKVRDEINSMLEKTSGNYDADDLYKLKYMDQVIKETLRKYPVLGAIGRKCTSPYNLDGLHIPEGTLINISIHSIHYDPNYYPNPMKFDPERFSSSSKIAAGTYLPFGLGPRTCIGMKFAQTEIILALIKLIPKYKLMPCDKTTIPLVLAPIIITTSKFPILLNVEAVKQN